MPRADVPISKARAVVQAADLGADRPLVGTCRYCQTYGAVVVVEVVIGDYFEVATLLMHRDCLDEAIA